VRILHCISTVDPATGGPIEGVRQISRVNAGHGHEIELLTLDPPDSPDAAAFPFPVHALGPGRTRYGYSSGLVPWLRAHAHRFDAVIVNGIWGHNLYSVWRALAGGRVPYFVFTHGMLDPWFKYRYPLKHLKKWLFWPWAVYPALRDASAVLFTCAEERDLARQSFWLYDCNEIVVSYGTPGLPDLARDYAAGFIERFPAVAGKRRFVFLGRVHPKKGPDLLIRALAALQKAGTWNPAQMCLVMAGPADGDYGGRLKALAARLGVADSIVWTGMLRGEDKWGALQSAEAFVLPSHQENFGIAVAESLSAGVPVLISRSVNIWRDIIDDGAGLAGQDSLDGCVALLGRWLAMEPGERARFAACARPCFEKRFTIRRAAVALLATIYHTLHTRSVRG
jgi:glycosyltransferase involved in cell wall biosynthesis